MKKYVRPQKRPVKRFDSIPKDFRNVQAVSCSLEGLSFHMDEVDEMDEPKKRKKKGFTLIEMVIVVCIIGILSTIAIPSFQKRIEYARQRTVTENTETLNTAVYDYMITHGHNETTFGNVEDEEKWEKVSSLIKDGFEGCEVVGYTFHANALNDCFMSQVIFRNTRQDIYTKHLQ